MAVYVKIQEHKNYIIISMVENDEIVNYLIYYLISDFVKKIAEFLFLVKNKNNTNTKYNVSMKNHM